MILKIKLIGLRVMFSKFKKDRSPNHLKKVDDILFYYRIKSYRNWG